MRPRAGATGPAHPAPGATNTRRSRNGDGRCRLTREEFAPIVAYLSAGTGKEMPRAQAEVYSDLLQDLPAASVWAAARAALAESAGPWLPSVGAMRQRAAGALHGPSPDWGE